MSHLARFGDVDAANALVGLGGLEDGDVNGKARGKERNVISSPGIPPWQSHPELHPVLPVRHVFTYQQAVTIHLYTRRRDE